MKKQKTYRNTLYACYLGSVSQAIIVNLAPLLFVIFQNEFAVSLEKIGLLVLINFMTQLTVDALCVGLADRISHRTLLVAAHSLCVVGLILMSALPGLLPSPYLGLVIAVVTFAMGGGLLEVLVSPVTDSLPGEAKSASMALLHSFYCWGHVAVVILTTGGLLLVGQANWRVLPILWAIVPLYNAFSFARVPLPDALPAHERMPLKALLTNKVFLLAIALMICSGASEQAMAQWASLFAEKGLGISKALGDLLGPCLFAVFMGLGRLLYGLYGAKIRLAPVLACSGVLCVVCYLVTSLSQNPFLSLMGCAVTGLSVSLMWPGVISLSARTFAFGGTALFSLLALGGDVGCAVGPWLTGVVAGSAGLKGGLLASAVFPVALFVGVLLLRLASLRQK